MNINYKDWLIKSQSWTFMDSQEGSLMFIPRYSVYQITLTRKIKNFTFGYEHQCTHSTYPDERFITECLYRGSHDRLFVKYKFKIK